MFFPLRDHTNRNQSSKRALCESLSPAEREIMASLNSRCFAMLGSHSNDEMKFVVCDCKNSCLRGKAAEIQWLGRNIERFTSSLSLYARIALLDMRWRSNILILPQITRAGQVEQTTKWRHSLCSRGNSHFTGAMTLLSLAYEINSLCFCVRVWRKCWKLAYSVH
jgi:hypothetical protein